MKIGKLIGIAIRIALQLFIVMAIYYEAGIYTSMFSLLVFIKWELNLLTDYLKKSKRIDTERDKSLNRSL